VGSRANDPLLLALDTIRRAEVTAEKVLRREYPVGRSCFYWHGHHRRACRVVGAGHGLRVQVQHRGSGAIVWIGAERLERDD
jgi:hypothetical protein